MEKRNIQMYSIQPTLSDFGLHSKDSEHFARETAALAVAIASEKNVVIKPEYRVYLHGTTDVAPPFREIQHGDMISTSHITEIYFEKVFIKGKLRTDLYVKTRHTTYLIRDYRRHMRASMRDLLRRAVISDGMTFESCKGYFSKVEETHPEIEVVC
ncbi:hypothetical protein IJI79_02480 [Candidatus Saccharibacteria bacterium]|nr:hypothetical protein [Candidatus Saccharibacteria bacterium]